MRRDQFRDVQAWKDQGLPITTTSNEAAKLYDSCLTQIVMWTDDPILGGLEKNLHELVEADPNFVLGRVLIVNILLEASGITPITHPWLRENVEFLEDVQASPDSITPRELLHVAAALKLADGKLFDTCRIWEDILIDYPTDLQALRQAHYTYILLGQPEKFRDVVGRVLTSWKSKGLPLEGCLHSMYAFGLTETRNFAKAEKEARISLEFDRTDGWGTHALAHVYEDTRLPHAGINLLNSTVQEWEQSTLLAGHNYWHLALYHNELGQYDEAVQVFDEIIAARAQTKKAMLSLIDASSLLWRWELEDQPVGQERKAFIHHISKFAPRKHLAGYSMNHIMLAICMGDPNGLEEAEELISTVKSNPNFIEKETSLQVLRAFMAYRDEKFDQVVELLHPIRYEIDLTGGSNAQTDLLSLILIVSAMKSSNPRHHRLALQLICEREANESHKSLLTSRLRTRAEMTLNNND